MTNLLVYHHAFLKLLNVSFNISYVSVYMGPCYFTFSLLCSIFKDPKKNRIAQWLNLMADKGIIQLSFSLDSQSQPGAYSIIAPNVQQEFHVTEYGEGFLFLYILVLIWKRLPL